MVSGLVTLWVAAALGQSSGAAGEAAWLKSVPADVEVVARVRGLEAGRDDLAKMIQATSPQLTAQAVPAIEQGLAQFRDRYGASASKAPFLFLMRLPKPGQGGGEPPWAVIVKADDYAGVLKNVAGQGGNATPKKQDGLDAITDAQGQTFYTTKGNGFVAFGKDSGLVGAVAKPGGSTLDSALTADVRRRLMTGDAGVYVNLAAVQEKYGDQIDQARQTFMGQLDAAPGLDDQTRKSAKELYGRLFDAIKDASALGLSLDFSGDGLDIGTDIALKPGSGASKAFADAQPSAAEGAGKLPANLAFYFYLNPSSAFVDRMTNFGLQMSPELQKSAEYKKAIDLQKQAGLKDMTVGVDFAKGGIRVLSIANYADPRKAVDALDTSFDSMKSNKAVQAASMLKDVTLERNAQKYRGFTLNHSRAKFDLEKMGKQAQNMPNGQDMMKRLMGESLDTWYGTDGKVFLSVAAPDWDRAKGMIDDYLAGNGTLAQSSGYRALRSKLPERVTTLMLASGQGLVRIVSTLASAMAPNNPGMKEPGDMPKEPAYIGTGILTSKDGIRFQTFIPSTVGPVVEKGLVPMLQGLGGQVNQ